MSKTAKIFLVISIALLVTLFILMWKSLGGGPTLAPRSAL